jgi:hypothetical protein
MRLEVYTLNQKYTIMKKIFAILAIGLGFTAANAQQIKQTEVPAIVKASFTKMIPGAKQTKWDKENGQYEASYVNGQHKGSVLFAADGRWAEREVVVPVNQLPKQAIQYMQQHYKTQPLKGAARITMANGDVQYEAEISGKDVFFTQQGVFIKAEKV